MTTHALYRFLDEAGELLYVGITMNPAARWRQHSLDKGWWTEVANITIEPYASRDEVLEAERLAIVTERPRYNVVHSAPRRPSTPELVWFCAECREPIEDRAGYLMVGYRELHVAELAAAEWESNHNDGIFNLAEFLAGYPAPVPWVAVHTACDPDPEDQVCYSIEVSRLRTSLDLLHWTLHLMEKTWLPFTDWTSLLSTVVNQEREG